jgi:hypothetical protein
MHFKVCLTLSKQRQMVEEGQFNLSFPFEKSRLEKVNKKTFLEIRKKICTKVSTYLFMKHTISSLKAFVTKVSYIAYNEFCYNNNTFGIFLCFIFSLIKDEAFQLIILPRTSQRKWMENKMKFDRTNFQRLRHQLIKQLVVSFLPSRYGWGKQ